MIALRAIAPLMAHGRHCQPHIVGRMAGHHPLNRYAVTGGAPRRFLVDKAFFLVYCGFVLPDAKKLRGLLVDTFGAGEVIKWLTRENR